MPTERTGPVACVVLAAGTSTRMGTNKLLLDLDGQPVVRRAACAALAAGLSPVVVVLGHESALVEQAIGAVASQVQLVVNPDFLMGVNSSLRTGILSLSDTVNACVVMLADMPFVTSAMSSGLVTEYRASHAPLVISDYDGVNAPPMLYDRALFGELMTMEGEGCGRAVVKRHRAEAAVLNWPGAALNDLDVPADYELIRESMRGG